MNSNKKQEPGLDRINKVARDVLVLSRNTLLVNLRFLDMALSRLDLVSVDGLTLATDGTHLGYGPKHILKCFKSEQERPVRDYLHVVLHCVFSHMFISSLVVKDVWNLACDIAVENTITDLGIKSTESARQARQKSEIDRLKTKVNMLTAEKIYAYYMDSNISDVMVKSLRNLFEADDHSVWYGDSEPFSPSLSPSSSTNSNSGQGSGNQNQPSGLNNNNSSEDGSRGSGSSSSDPQNEEDSQQNQSSSSSMSRSELEEDWKKVAETIQQDLETFSKERGDTAGGMMQNLASVNREKYDYTSFLKKFAVLGEAMVINDEEFDYIFYTYGLIMYKNMPLIEPLEYKEVKRIKEFVIAIDTSGSTSGELVQKFIQKTYNILKSTESFFSKINVHIIQCDAEIQDHVKITSEEEFDEYLKSMKIYGLGGTDFRPVFSFVDDLVEAKEFSNLKGLIYFTDGWGTFPLYKPEYETAFVFLDNDYHNPEVPPWAIKLVLQDDEI